MKKILYISNIEVPYRVRFFNELAKHCDLTVLYERERSSNRNSDWTKSVCRSYRIKYLHGIKVGRENSFSLGILKEIFSGYDRIIVGCYNSPVQMMTILALRLCRKKYIVNLDGEPFLDGSGLKAKLKRFFLRGAAAYLAAGEKAAASLRSYVNKPVVAYPFSSLTKQELEANRAAAANCRRDDTVLVVGQYFDYKGMDVALEAARLDPSLHYQFVGMGGRTELFRQEQQVPGNVELIPFLQKQELEQAYQSCAMLVLPSRQECWGLVVNEAASFGTPIVSTWGSGAAVEFLGENYPQYLARPGDGADLLRCIRQCRDDRGTEAYSRFLLEKSKDHHIENNVQACLEALSR